MAETLTLQACPTAAMHGRPDGIVDFDTRFCIGWRARIAACPYDAIFINPEDQSAEKCTFGAQRLDGGLEPAVLHSPDGTGPPHSPLRPLKPGREACRLPGARSSP